MTAIGPTLLHAHHRHAMLERLEDARPRGQAFVARLDADGSGDLDGDEIAGSFLGRVLEGEAFAATDADASGTLDAAELDARHEQVVATLTTALAGRAEARNLFTALVET